MIVKAMDAKIIPSKKADVAATVFKYKDAVEGRIKSLLYIR
jgi:2-oxoglutarate dehydrogenase complex dehydrogenase (E1) component-like enzyme